jgi:hypothetical protein
MRSRARPASLQYQHTSVLATLKKIFGLPKFLTKRVLETPPELAGDEPPHLVEAQALRVAMCEQALSEARAALEELLLGLAARNSAADNP